MFPTSKTAPYKKLVVEALNRKETEGNSENLLGYIIDASKGNLRCEKGKTKEERTVGFVDDELEVGYHAEDQKKKWTADELTAHAMMFLISREYGLF